MKLMSIAALLFASSLMLAAAIIDNSLVVESAAEQPSPTPTASPTQSRTRPVDNPYYEPSADDLLDGPLGSRDVDCDGVRNSKDNCLLTYNPSQVDKNTDGIGDLCRPDPLARTVRFLRCDDDGDGLIDEADNCPWVCNPDQIDTNRNTIGDACERAIPQAGLNFRPCAKRKNVKLPTSLSRRHVKP